MDYARRFDLATERTRRLGLVLPAFERREIRLLDATVHDGLARVVRDSLGPPETDDGNLARLELHYRLLGPLTAHLRVPLCFTIGAAPGTVDEDELRELATRRRDPRGLRLHSWLTLPSLEIVDATSVREVIAGHPDELSGTAYHPLIVGVDFLWRSGVIGGVASGRLAPDPALS